MDGERFYCLAEYGYEQKSAVGKSWRKRTISSTRAHVCKQFKLLAVQIHFKVAKQTGEYSLTRQFCTGSRKRVNQ